MRGPRRTTAMLVCVAALFANVALIAQSSVVDTAPAATTSAANLGYRLVASDGGIFSFGGARYFGSTGGMHLNRPIVDMASTLSDNGYWLLASDGGIFAFGDARYLGSTGAIRLNRPIVAMATTPTGRGYWLVASDGGIFAFGDARYLGSTGAMRLNRPIVGMATTPTGRGYWLVASDGGIFAFGDARYLGSTGATRLNRPIVGIASTSGRGYWLVASDGGIFAFGDARYLGSPTAARLGAPIVSIARTSTSRGYWLAGASGAVFGYGDAATYGSMAATQLVRPIVSIAGRGGKATGGLPPSGGVCGHSGAPAAHQKVVVFAFENRTWSGVGGTQFGSVPYFNSLAKQCPTFANFTEPNTGQNSATQYVGTVTGSNLNTVLDDCSPSPTCNSLQNNIFRQARVAGQTATNYVEGATAPCSASGNAAKHIPALYMWGADDQSHCTQQVRPFSEFNPNNVPNFAFITPNLCNDGHDCGNSQVSAWARAHVQAVLNSAAYKAGQVTVFIWYDEDHPVPNMELGVHAVAGVKSTAIDYGSMLKAWEDLLGVPRIAHAVDAVDLRPIARV
jgi:hypothetical protein